MIVKFRFPKVAVFLLCLAPAAWLIFSALTDRLSANPIKDITEETGTWALRFVLLTLCVTPFRKLTGWNEVIQYRRMLGLYAFFYGFLHFLTYAWLDQFFSIPDIAQDVYKRPFITAGFSAFVVMIPLAITSTRKWIARLGGRRWQLLHRLTYVGAIAGVVHYLWLVKADTERPLIYGLLLSILLGFRVLQSLRSNHPLGIRTGSTVSVRHSTLLLLAVLLFTSPFLLGQNPQFDVGIKVGERIPSFKLSDQNGSLRDFNSVKGPKGVVLLFFRSADW
jgi:methionine sulfoxide reductase heme-binding subunit